MSFPYPFPTKRADTGHTKTSGFGLTRGTFGHFVPHAVERNIKPTLPPQDDEFSLLGSQSSRPVGPKTTSRRQDTQRSRAPVVLKLSYGYLTLCSPCLCPCSCSPSSPLPAVCIFWVSYIFSRFIDAFSFPPDTYTHIHSHTVIYTDRSHYSIRRRRLP